MYNLKKLMRCARWSSNAALGKERRLTNSPVTTKKPFMIADPTRKSHYTLKHQPTTCHWPALRFTHDRNAPHPSDMHVDSSDKHWAPTQNLWYAISPTKLWSMNRQDAVAALSCVLLFFYQRCTNCSSAHQTIVLIICALVKKATTWAMSVQSLRTWCLLKRTYQQSWRALLCSMVILPFVWKLASWLQFEKGSNTLRCLFIMVSV